MPHPLATIPVLTESLFSNQVILYLYYYLYYYVLFYIYILNGYGILNLSFLTQIINLLNSKIVIEVQTCHSQKHLAQHFLVSAEVLSSPVTCNHIDVRRTLC